MGNEQSGVSKEIESNAQELIKLPMMGTSDSLNLSVSTGIFLYEIFYPTSLVDGLARNL